MLSVKDLRTLEAGDVVEAGTIFAGMTKEPLKLEVKSASDTAQPDFEMRLRGTYFGVFVGTWELVVKDDKAVWTQIQKLPALPAPEPVA